MHVYSSTVVSLIRSEKVAHHWLNALTVAQFPNSFGHYASWLSMSIVFKARNIRTFLNFGFKVRESVLNSF